MKKLLLFVIPILLAIIVFIVLYFLLGKQEGKGALQVTSLPKSNVFLNGKMVGQTPLCKCEGTNMLPVGSYTIRLEPQDTTLSAFEEKIKITKSILTVVDHTFAKNLSS